MPRRALSVSLVLAAALALAPAALAGPIIDRAVEGLAGDPVYVDPTAERALSAAEAEQIRERIRSAGAGPLYIAVLPDRAADETGGDPDQVLVALRRELGREGTYAVVVGDAFRAGSDVLGGTSAGKLASEALEEHVEEGVAPTLLAFVERVGEVRTGGGEGGGGGGGGSDGSGVGSFVIPVLAAGGIGFFLLRRRRRRQVEQAELAEVREAAQDDLLALAEGIRALDLDVEMPNAPAEAKEDYTRALSSYERADEAIDRARRPEDLEPVSAAVEEGRFALASAKARLEGREPPERRPPCFFDPRHGPSTRDVEWTPPWGEPRLVPACEADALRVEEGLEPATREVMVGGRATPYWNAPPAYGPWAGGFFGGFGGLFPGLLIGSMLGGGIGPHVYVDGDADDGGFGDGDFGGGDFGGGDFGGGDFGGGDFGGGD